MILGRCTMVVVGEVVDVLTRDEILAGNVLVEDGNVFIVICCCC